MKERWFGGVWASQQAYRLQFEVFSGWLVEGHSLQKVGADLHRDSGQLTLDGLRHGLYPASLLGLHIAAAALHTHNANIPLLRWRRVLYRDV